MDEELQRLARQVRSGSASATTADDAIPMLTEVVDVPRYEASELPQSLDEVDWSQLATRVRENVLERLLTRSDALLAAQLGGALHQVIERAASSLAAELRLTLEQLIRDLVARAVADEITRVHDDVSRAAAQRKDDAASG